MLKFTEIQFKCSRGVVNKNKYQSYIQLISLIYFLLGVKKQILTTYIAGIRKKTDPRVNIQAPALSQLGLTSTCMNTYVPMMKISPPNEEMLSITIFNRNQFQAALNPSFDNLKTQAIFQSWAIVKRKDPTMKRSIPVINLLTSGNNKIEPTRYKKVETELKVQMMIMLRYLQSCRQWRSSVMSARRRVKDPTMQNQMDTSLMMLVSSMSGNKRIEPATKVRPPKRKLPECQSLH